jgi:hypothetical protein
MEFSALRFPTKNSQDNNLPVTQCALVAALRQPRAPPPRLIVVKTAVVLHMGRMRALPTVFSHIPVLDTRPIREPVTARCGPTPGATEGRSRGLGRGRRRMCGPCLPTGVWLSQSIRLRKEAVRRQNRHAADDRQAAQKLLQSFGVGRLLDVQQQADGVFDAAHGGAPASVEPDVL